MGEKSNNLASVAQGVLGYCRGALRLARENSRTLVLLVAAFVFVVLLNFVAAGDILTLDTLAYRLFVGKLRSDAVTPIMEGFTSLSSIVVIGVMTLILATLAPGRAPGWCASINLVAVVILNTVLKYIVQRPRPDGFRLVTESGYSFPSGHSMVSMAFFGLIIWMVWRYHKKDVWRLIWCAAFAFVLVMVGISRIYLGVHYASDVLAGFAVSLIWLVFYTKVVAPAFMPEPTEQ